MLPTSTATSTAASLPGEGEWDRVLPAGAPAGPGDLRPDLDLDLAARSGGPVAARSAGPRHAGLAVAAPPPGPPGHRTAGRRRRLLAGAGLVLAGAAVGAALALLGVRLAPPPRREEPDAADAAALTFLVVGDWGRNHLPGGSLEQRRVAEAMERVAGQRLPAPPRFVVSSGDNFYGGGLGSVNDAAFTETFTDVYSSRALQVPWHAVLGNVDYGDCGTRANGAEKACPPGKAARSAAHQLDPALQARDWRWNPRRAGRLRPAAALELFFLDTTPLLAAEYAHRAFAALPDGLLEQDPDAILRRLDADLAASSAPVKIVVGHHPVFSNGFRGGAAVLQERLLPILEAHRVSAYVNGHDHDLQLVEARGLTFFTSGAGSKTGRGFRVGKGSAFEHDAGGFLSVSLAEAARQVTFTFWDAGAEPLFERTLPF